LTLQNYCDNIAVEQKFCHLFASCLSLQGGPGPGTAFLRQKKEEAPPRFPPEKVFSPFLPDFILCPNSLSCSHDRTVLRGSPGVRETGAKWPTGELFQSVLIDPCASLVHLLLHKGGFYSMIFRWGGKLRALFIPLCRKIKTAHQTNKNTDHPDR